MSAGERQPDDIRERLAAVGTATLCDALDGRELIGTGVTRISGASVMCGRAITADCADGSVKPIAAAMRALDRDDVLCVAAPGTRACLGDLLTSELVRVGAATTGLSRYPRSWRRRRSLVGRH